MSEETMLTCEWCGHRTPAIHRHHWPIPKRDGGTETVNICATCHATAHGRVFINLRHCHNEEEYLAEGNRIILTAIRDRFPKFNWRYGDPFPIASILVIPPAWRIKEIQQEKAVAK